MGRSKDVTEEKKIAIRTLLNAGDYSQRGIARKIGVSPATVCIIAKKLRDGQASKAKRPSRKRTNRPTTPREDRKIKVICMQNRKQPLHAIGKIIRDAGINLSNRTVRRRLKDLGFKCCRPARKPLQTEMMGKKRLAWAKSHKNLTVNDWEQVCFSDESTFQIFKDKTVFVRRRTGEKYLPECLVKTVKHPLSIMVWSVINSRGAGRLYIVEGTMRQDQYKKVIRTRLLPQLKEWFRPRQKFVFMHDSAPCHKAKSVTAYLKYKKIPVLEWPGNSPDMHPIENIWELVKRQIAKECVTNKTQLIERLIHVWNHEPRIQENIKSCASSMPDRIKALIKANGGTTKY